MNLVPETVDIIAFHGNCPDGWCAAYIAKKKYPDAELRPMSYGKVEINGFVDKHVLVVDFSWPRQITGAMEATAKSLIIYDHHATAQVELAGLDYAVFDMNRSGAGITWDMLNPEWKRPWYVNYVEDRDLWNWKLPRSREVSAYLMALPQTMEVWDSMDASFRDGAEYDDVPAYVKVAEFGKAILLHIDHYIEKVSANHVIGNFFGHKTAMVNAPYVNISDVCNKLLDYADIGMGWFQRTDGLIQFSLCSRGDLDVSALAKIFGGGGHKAAAGFQIDTHQARILIDKFPAHS